MARFDKLEFGGSPEEPRRTPSTPLRHERDEKYWIAQADDCRRSGQYESALRFYSRALEQDKSLVDCWIGQARMLIFLEEYPQAELWSRTGLGLFPSNAGLLASRAQAFCRMKQTRKAHELSDGSLRQDSRSAYAWLVRGEIMVADRQDLDTHCFDSAQQFDPDWLVPLEIALVYLHYRVPSKALLRARRAVEMAPDRYYAWYVQGLCQEQLGFDASARQSYQRCLELSPRNTDAERRLLALDGQGWSPARFFRRLFSGMRGEG